MFCNLNSLDFQSDKPKLTSRLGRWNYKIINEQTFTSSGILQVEVKLDQSSIGDLASQNPCMVLQNYSVFIPVNRIAK